MFKSKIRNSFLEKRNNFYKRNLHIKFSKVYSLVKRLNFQKKIIGGYYPVNSEVDDIRLLMEFRKKGFKTSLPVIKKNFTMIFVEWSSKEPLYVNRFGIPEPSNTKKVIPDIILVPLVSFDKKLTRLGYGGGFYDRFLKNIKDKKKIVKIGLAFSCQLSKNFLPKSPHDQAVDFVVTEKKIY